MYTTHGYQIVNTPVEGEKPFERACGGPARCRTCKLESDYYNTHNEGVSTIELGPKTLQALERTLALTLAQRPLSQAQQARVQIRNLNTGAAIAKVSEVIDASMSVTISDHGRLLKELLEAGIEFYYNPDAQGN